MKVNKLVNLVMIGLIIALVGILLNPFPLLSNIVVGVGIVDMIFWAIFSIVKGVKP